MFRWPDTSKHTLLMGANGSGKTVWGAHFLSNADFISQPWIITDYKSEELLNDIPGVEYINFKQNLKRLKRGIYILPARPEIDDDHIESFLWRVLEHERVGLFYDEGYMIPYRRPYGAQNAIYTQGRSKRVPTITLTQRPVGISRFAFSEAAFYGYLRLNDIRDQKTVEGFVPRDENWNFERDIPKYSMRWYDVGNNASMILAPSPDPQTILQKFEDRLSSPRKVY